MCKANRLKFKEGDLINGLVYICEDGKRGSNGCRMVKVGCFCRNEFSTSLAGLRNGHTKSCGCIVKKHGLTKSPEFVSWVSMKKRCNDKKCSEYRNYGARGISVCDRWQNSFLNFLTDMGKRPSGLSLERIDNYGNYCKENCKWDTKFNQCRNRRNNVKFTYNGKTMVLQDWASEFNINRGTLRFRLLVLKWPFYKAILRQDFRYAS